MPTRRADQHKAVTALTGRAKAALIAAWPSAGSAEQVRDALLTILPAIGDEFTTAAASLAADWYDDLREERRVPGRHRSLLPEPPDLARYEALARWGVSPLFTESPNVAAAQSLVSGGLGRIVANGHRDTVMLNAVADPQALGWSRYGSGSSCEFCQMLISRGDVYTEATADFEAHDHCNCIAGPRFTT